MKLPPAIRSRISQTILHSRPASWAARLSTLMPSFANLAKTFSQSPPFAAMILPSSPRFVTALLHTVSFSSAVTAGQERNTEPAIINSSSVRIKRIVTLLPSIEITAVGLRLARSTISSSDALKVPRSSDDGSAVSEPLASGHVRRRFPR